MAVSQILKQAATAYKQKLKHFLAGGVQNVSIPVAIFDQCVFFSFWSSKAKSNIYLNIKRSDRHITRVWLPKEPLKPPGRAAPGSPRTGCTDFGCIEVNANTPPQRWIRSTLQRDTSPRRHYIRGGYHLSRSTGQPTWLHTTTLVCLSA